MKSVAAISVDADGVLMLTGRSEACVLAPAVVARSSALTEVAEGASEGDTITLPLSQAMADAWLAAIAAESKGSPLLRLGSSSLQLTQTLVVRPLGASLKNPCRGYLLEVMKVLYVYAVTVLSRCARPA